MSPASSMRPKSVRLPASRISLRWGKWSRASVSTYPPETAFTEASFQIKHIQPVGGYAVQIFWKDGHGTGLYSHELLRALGEKA